MKYELKYRVFIKYCVFSLKCFDFSYVSGIYFKIFEKKTQYLMNTLFLMNILFIIYDKLDAPLVSEIVQ